MGNARLVGGPEDGVEVDLVWPFPQEIRRAHDGAVLVYEHEGEEDSRVIYRHAGSDDPGDTEVVPADGDDGE